LWDLPQFFVKPESWQQRTYPKNNLPATGLSNGANVLQEKCAVFESAITQVSHPNFQVNSIC